MEGATQSEDSAAVIVKTIPMKTLEVLVIGGPAAGKTTLCERLISSDRQLPSLSSLGGE